MNKPDCSCVTLGATRGWTEGADIGTSSGYWDVSRICCGQCGTLWLQANLEHLAFSRSGRFYRAPVTDDMLEALTPDDGMSLLKSATMRIAGGSLWDGVEHVSVGPGELQEWP